MTIFPVSLGDWICFVVVALALALLIWALSETE